MSFVLFGTVSQCCDATSILDGIIFYIHIMPFEFYWNNMESTNDPTDKMATRNYLLFTQYNSPPVLFLEYNGHMAVHLLLLSCLLAKCFSWLEGRVCMATYKQGLSVKDERKAQWGWKSYFIPESDGLLLVSVWGAVFLFLLENNKLRDHGTLKTWKAQGVCLCVLE